MEGKVVDDCSVSAQTFNRAPKDKQRERIIDFINTGFLFDATNLSILYTKQVKLNKKKHTFVLRKCAFNQIVSILSNMNKKITF